MSKDTNPHWEGGFYNQNSQTQFTVGVEILGQYPFRGDEVVLDIGCGTGRTTQETAKRVPNGSVLGIDGSESMLEIARANNKLENLQFMQMDAQSLNFHKRFDVITSTFCIHWIPDKIKVLKGIKDALKPGAKAVLIMSLRHPIFAELRTQLIQKERWRSYFKDYVDPTVYFINSSYDEYAKAVGLNVQNYTQSKFSDFFSDLMIFTNYIRAITPHLSQLDSEEQKRLFMEELMDSYLHVFPKNREGNYRIDYTTLKLEVNRYPD